MLSGSTKPNQDRKNNRQSEKKTKQNTPSKKEQTKNNQKKTKNNRHKEKKKKQKTPKKKRKQKTPKKKDKMQRSNTEPHERKKYQTTFLCARFNLTIVTKQKNWELKFITFVVFETLTNC